MRNLTTFAALVAALSMQGGFALAGGKYDTEIATMRRQFGAYIGQSEKNIAALSKLDSAYERTADAMEAVVRARHGLQGRCPTGSKNALLECLSRQGTAISFLDLYARQGLEIMPGVLSDAREAGKILNQDVSGHLKKLEGIAAGFKTWNDVTIPALRKQLEHDRESLKKLYGAEFVADYRFAADRQAALNEAALLSHELIEASARLVSRGQGFLAEHRIGHARLTAQAIKWLADRVPVMWKALDVDVQKDSRVTTLKERTRSRLLDAFSSLDLAARRRDASTERQAALLLLKGRVASNTALLERDRMAFEKLFQAIEGLEADLPNRDAVVDTLIERGFIWLGVASK